MASGRDGVVLGSIRTSFDVETSAGLDASRLRYLGGMTYEAAAEHLRRPLGTPSVVVFAPPVRPLAGWSGRPIAWKLSGWTADS